MRVENQWIGEEGGVISSKVIPLVQAVFPQGALNKKVKVGLQVGICELKHLTRYIAKCAKKTCLQICLFVIFDSLRPINNLGTGLAGLNLYSARINVSCSRAQHSDAGEAPTRCLSASGP